jgi:ribonuclease E
MVTDRRNGPTGAQGAGRPATPPAAAAGAAKNAPKVPDRPTVGITRSVPPVNGNGAASTTAPKTALATPASTAAPAVPAPSTASSTSASTTAPAATAPAATAPAVAAPEASDWPASAPASRAPATTERPRTGWAATSPLRKALFGVALVLLLVAPAVVAGLLSAAQAPVYESRAEILYERTPVTDAQTIERELATQQVLLQSEAFVDTAAEAVDRDPEELRQSITVEVLEESNFLQLAVRDEDRDRALAAATSLVDQYVAAVERRSAETSTAARERALIEPQIEALTTRVQEITERLATLVPIPTPSAAVQLELRDLEAERQAARQQITELRGEILEADRQGIQEGAAPVSVITPPFLEEDPVGPQPLRAAAAGLLVGILLVVALLAGLRQRNRRSPSPAP